MSCDVTCVSDRSRSKYNPCPASQQKCTSQHNARSNGRIRVEPHSRKYPISRGLTQLANDQVCSVQQSPKHIRPIGTVPQAAQPKGDENVPHPAQVPAPTASHRNVYIVLE